MTLLHEASCACCSGIKTMLDRRRFVGALIGGGATLTFAPQLALSAEGNYEAMVLACIDPRMQEPVHRYTVEQNLTGKFSQFVIAGAAIGVVAPAFKNWHKAFWDNLATTIELHRIKKVIAIDHRDCGAAKIAYGEAKVANPQVERRKRIGRLLGNSVNRLESATTSSAWKPASWRSTARWRCSSEGAALPGPTYARSATMFALLACRTREWLSSQPNQNSQPVRMR